MSTKIVPKGLEAFAGSMDWVADTIKMSAIGPTDDTAMKVVTGATNANPAVIAATGHGASVDDEVVIGTVLGNLAVNGRFKVASVVDADHITLKTVEDGLDVQGSGAYTSGGFLLNLSLAQNRQDLNAAEVGNAYTLLSKTQTNGELDAADPTITGISGKVVGAMAWKDTGSQATSRCAIWHDGRVQVTVAADAVATETQLWVNKLTGAIPSGTVLTFSNGKSATLSAGAALGDRYLTVNALSDDIGAGHTADAPTTNNNLPFEFIGAGTISLTLTFGAYIAKL